MEVTEPFGWTLHADTLRVIEVLGDSQAERARVKTGYRLVSVGGVEVSSMASLLAQVEGLREQAAGGVAGRWKSP